MSNEKIKLDPRLANLHKSVVFRLYETKIGPLLIAEKLMDTEEQPLSPMTEEGMDLLLNTIMASTAVALCQAEIQIPIGFALDEIELTNNMTTNFGTATVKADEANNNLSLRFDGIGALVQNLDLPLRIDEAMSLKIDKGENVIQIKIGKKPIITGRGLIEEPPLVNPSLSLRQ